MEFMHIEEVRRLVRLVEESDVDELDIWKWWGRIRIRKTAAQNGIQVSGGGMIPMPQAAPPPAAPPASDPVHAAPAEAAEEEGLVPIKSPMVGTFYAAPAPDADPYMQTGDVVEPGQTVCIIEAMKLMNEIQSEVKGTVVKILAENAKPVEFGQTLFLVREL